MYTTIYLSYKVSYKGSAGYICIWWRGLYVKVLELNIPSVLQNQTWISITWVHLYGRRLWLVAIPATAPCVIALPRICLAFLFPHLLSLYPLSLAFSTQFHQLSFPSYVTLICNFITLLYSLSLPSAKFRRYPFPSPIRSPLSFRPPLSSFSLPPLFALFLALPFPLCPFLLPSSALLIQFYEIRVCFSSRNGKIDILAPQTSWDLTILKFRNP